MKRDQIVKNVGYRVQLEPPACSLDEFGGEIERREDDWIIEAVPEEWLRIKNVATDHVTTLGYDEYRGTTASGRINAGRLTAGMPLARISHDGAIHEEEARYLTKHQGLDKIDVDEAEAGSIVVIAGLTDIAIGETLADPEHPIPLPSISVEEPTLRM